MSRLAFRVMVYVILYAFTFLHVSWASHFAELGVMPQSDIEPLRQAFWLLGSTITAVMLWDFSTILSKLAVEHVGKHRLGYSVVATGVTAVVAGFYFSPFVYFLIVGLR